MKTVFTSAEIAHIWVNRGASYGRCAANMSFDSDTFSSYNTVIARRIRHRGKEAYVCDQAGFSNTTRRHQGAIISAVRAADRVFNVHIGSYGQRLTFTAAQLRDYYLREWREMGKASPSRYEHARAEAYLHRHSRLCQALAVCEYFGLPAAKIAKQIRGERKEEARNQAIVDAWNAKLAERRARADKRARVAREAREARQAIEDRDNIALWLAGASISPRYSWPTLLRAEGDEMVTTKGARVPLSDAKRTYGFAVRVKGHGWHRNGETHGIGVYQLDAVNEQGVVAGCHRVTWEEIERFAATQNWK